jgi:hypothetical protein
MAQICTDCEHDFPRISFRLSLVWSLADAADKCIQFETLVYLYPVLKQAALREDVLRKCRYSSTHSLTLALDGGEWPASRPGRFTSEERAPSTHWIGGWLGPRAGLNTVSKRKILSNLPESNPEHPIVQSVVCHYTDWAIPAHKTCGGVEV